MDQYDWFRIAYDKDGYVVGTSSKADTSDTWTDKQAVAFTTTDNAKNIYVLGADTLLAATSIDIDDVTLIAQSMNTSDANSELTLDNFTLYAYNDRNTKDTGIHLKKDANAVLIETSVDGKRVIQYFDDSDAKANVQAALDEMESTKFNGTVYYVMKDGEATTVIIVDTDPHNSEGIQGPNNKKVARMIYGTQPADIGPHIWAGDSSNNGVSGAIISLYILKDEGYVKVGDFTTNASGDTPTLPTIAGNNYKAVCGSVEYLFAT